MQTVVFWSFKGGGGRTLTLANVAGVLARLGKRVLCIDLDLEAPGLPGTLGDSQGREGFVEYAKRWIDTGDPGDLTISDIAIEPTPSAGSAGTGDALLRVVYAGDYISSEHREAYWDTIVKGVLEVLFPLPPQSHVGEIVSDSEAKTYEKIYAGFWSALRDELSSLSPPPDYLLVDTRTGLSPLSRTSISVFTGSVTDDDGSATGLSERPQLAIIVDPSSEASKTGTVEYLRRLPQPGLGVTVVQRAQPLLSGLTGTTPAEEDWLGDASALVKRILTISWNLNVEKNGQTLVPPSGSPTYYPLLDDYLRIAVSLFPEIREQIGIDPNASMESVLEALRQRLGVTHPEPDDFKLFQLTAGGRMQNVKDDSPNISFKVATLQSMLDTLWRHAKKGGLPDGLGTALEDAGLTAGTEFGKELTKLASDAQLLLKDLILLWCQFDSQVGWGRLEVEFGDDDGVAEHGVLHIWHNAFAEDRAAPKDPDLCTFMSGYIKGVLSSLMGDGKEVTVNHEEADPCIRRGADHCAFRFEVGTDGTK
jgi:predicted hydrocarbon binding protein